MRQWADGRAVRGGRGGGGRVAPRTLRKPTHVSRRPTTRSSSTSVPAATARWMWVTLTLGILRAVLCISRVGSHEAVVDLVEVQLAIAVGINVQKLRLLRARTNTNAEPAAARR